MAHANTNDHTITEKPEVFRQKMLDWYDKHRRSLPWRAEQGEKPNPYHVWLSEIMLQQTTVPAVIPYFLKFIERWPTIHDLANANNEAVMSNWAGLGYYARARNLHKCAKIISSDHDGVFPHKQEELKSLPGIGDYTSAAISSIAFNKPSCVVDGNVERVMARYHALKTPLPEGKKTLKYYAQSCSDGFTNRPGDYAQSLMDLGATICTPKSPLCALCPISENCIANVQGNAEHYPLRSPKKQKPQKHGYVYWVTNEHDEVLLHKRPEKGLLGGMLALPTSDWNHVDSRLAHPDVYARHSLKERSLFIDHVFTHFSLRLHLIDCKVNTDSFAMTDAYKWKAKKALPDVGFPTVFKKAYTLFI